MTHKPKSLASDLFKVLMEEFPIGAEFTSAEFKAVENIKGLNASEGAVQGFLNRAIKKDVIRVTRTFKSAKGQINYIYQVIKHEPWGFHSAGIGSHEGRKLNQTRHINMGIEENITVVESKKSETATMEQWAKDEAKAGTAFDSIIVRLLEIAALLEASKLQTKTITEFTDDEIADEVKRRFHSK